MTTATKLVSSFVLTVAIVLVVRHGLSALRPVVPGDMPRDAHFVQSGYDLRRNEPQGDWVACSADANQPANFCRVTDTHGMVIYQGDFLSVHSGKAVSKANLRFAARDPRSLWVEGPVEAAPVPVIPLADGQILVPAADSDALAVRWSRDPDELTRLELQ